MDRRIPFSLGSERIDKDAVTLTPKPSALVEIVPVQVELPRKDDKSIARCPDCHHLAAPLILPESVTLPDQNGGGTPIPPPV